MPALVLPVLRNKRGGRPMTYQTKRALLNFFAFARQRDSATVTELREVMETHPGPGGLDVKWVVRRVAPWATFARLRGADAWGGTWTWRTPEERVILDIQNQEWLRGRRDFGLSPADAAIIRELPPQRPPAGRP